jgi:hypothetical protein
MKVLYNFGQELEIYNMAVKVKGKKLEINDMLDRMYEIVYFNSTHERSNIRTRKLLKLTQKGKIEELIKTLKAMP